MSRASYSQLSLIVLLLYIDYFFKYPFFFLYYSLAKIDDKHLFAHFKLGTLRLSLDNLKTFLHQDNAWMASLNEGVIYTSSQAANSAAALLVKFDFPGRYGSFNVAYTYLDEDICLFKHFPHLQIVLPLIMYRGQVDCTCTVRFLVKYNWAELKDYWNSPEQNVTFLSEADQVYNNFVAVIHLNKTHEYCHSKLYNETESVCDFGKMLARCNTSSFTANSVVSGLNDMDLFYAVMWLRYVLLIILHPVLCLMGMVNNAVTILVVRNKAMKKVFSSKMFKYLQLNAAFNIAYCGTMTLRLATECLAFKSSVFCSAIYQWNSVQYFKIIGVLFLGGLAKTCSNLSYMLFSVSRLVFISEHLKKNSIFDKFSRMNVKLSILFVLALGCVLNGYKLFNYELNVTNFPHKEFPFETSDVGECHRLYSLRCKLFSALKLFDRLVNDVGFFVLFVLLDLILYKKFRREVDKKKRIIGIHSTVDTTKKKNAVTKMIIINGALNFVPLFPQFASTLSLIVFSARFYLLCTRLISCDLINENFQVFAALPIVLQIFIFMRFNSNFGRSLRSIFFKDNI